MHGMGDLHGIGDLHGMGDLHGIGDLHGMGDLYGIGDLFRSCYTKSRTTISKLDKNSHFAHGEALESMSKHRSTYLSENFKTAFLNLVCRKSVS